MRDYYYYPMRHRIEHIKKYKVSKTKQNKKIALIK